jgi:mono/diheme cytochrome c family protein
MFTFSRTEIVKFTSGGAFIAASRTTILKVIVLAALIGGGEASAAEPATPSGARRERSRGQLANPYAETASVAEEGRKIYRALDCGGCHGGGGGMAAPLTNPVWVYGEDDDTLFRLIVLGTGSISPKGSGSRR